MKYPAPLSLLIISLFINIGCATQDTSAANKGRSSCYWKSEEDRAYADKLMQRNEAITADRVEFEKSLVEFKQNIYEAALIGHPKAIVYECLMAKDNLAPAELRETGLAVCEVMLAKDSYLQKGVQLEPEIVEKYANSRYYLAAKSRVEKWRCPSLDR
jgi:hypothetical protein